MWTCLGPQPLYLYDPYPQLWLRPMHQAYITPGETISLPHLLWNFQEVTVTVALTYTSKAGLPRGLYEGGYLTPTVPRAEIAGPLILGTASDNRGRGLWAIEGG